MAQGIKVPTQVRLKQAKESLEDAKNLIVQEAGANFVMNSVYYAFLFALYGLLEVRGLSAPNKEEVVSLFEREYVSTGQIDVSFLNGIRKAFDLRPACDCEGKKVAAVTDIEQLLPIAEEFLALAERLTA
jgi:uncharacterized protein (UPF0332 family)